MCEKKWMLPETVGSPFHLLQPVILLSVHLQLLSEPPILTHQHAAGVGG